MNVLTSDVLDIAYLDEGPPGAPVARLRVLGYRTLRPWLRGFGPTRFRSGETLRDGRSVALAQDALDLLDGLGVGRCVVVGHDWGAAAAPPSTSPP